MLFLLHSRLNLKLKMGTDGESEKVEASQAKSHRFETRRMQRISASEPQKLNSSREEP